MRQEDYPPGTIVFAKLKGYPWWPARVEDDKNVPANVRSAKSTKSKSPVWTVFFFGSRDYGFFGPDAIKPFHPANVERDLNDKKFKTKDLENAIRQALYPSLLNDEEDEDVVQEQKEKPQRTRNTAKKKVTGGGKRLSKTGEDKDEDEDEDEDEEPTTAKRRPRKAKPPLDSADASSRKKRLKASSTDKEDGNDDHASPVPGYNGDSPSTPESDKTKTATIESDEYKIYYRRMYMLRHRLQRLVYNKNPGEIPKGEYKTISTVLKSVEDAHMTAQLLRDTKIGTVIKSAGQYKYEDDNEFNIQHRCRLLMGRWREQFTPHRHHHGENGNKYHHSPAAATPGTLMEKEDDTVRSTGTPPNMTDKIEITSMPIGQAPAVTTTPTAS